MTDLPVLTAADVEAQPSIDLAEFTNDDAVELGLIAVEVIRERNLNLAVRIVLRHTAQPTKNGASPFFSAEELACNRPVPPIRRKKEPPCTWH